MVTDTWEDVHNSPKPSGSSANTRLLTRTRDCGFTHTHAEALPSASQEASWRAETPRGRPLPPWPPCTTPRQRRVSPGPSPCSEFPATRPSGPSLCSHELLGDTQRHRWHKNEVVGGQRWQPDMSKNATLVQFLVEALSSGTVQC